MIKHILLPLTAALSLTGCAASNAAPAPVSANEVSANEVSANEVATGGMVSSADPRASEAGAAILRQGGSATDAAIAVMLALTVVEPQSSGIGGGGFYLRAASDGEVVTLDGREKAPSGATPQWFLGEDGEPLGYRESVLSGLSIGVPGNIALAAEAHAKYGKLPWADLFQPAIALARDGFVITERMHMFLNRFKARGAAVEAGRDLYYDAEGEPLPAGSRITVPALADTLQTIAEGGAEAFYGGDLAAEMAATIAADTPRDGAMTREDIAAYDALWREPVCGTYRGHLICGMGPPSSGATTVLAMLGQLEQFDLAALGPDSPVSWHLFIESQRLAYADRELYLADSDFVPVPVAELIAPDYLAMRGALISPNARLEAVEAGVPAGHALSRADGDELPERGTSHLVTADRWGNAVTYTSTIEGPFGSGRMAGGFYLNNELTDFSRSPERDGMPVANRVEGNKRPRSSMAPTLIFAPDGELLVAIGAAGGSTIPVQVAKSIIGIIDWDLPAEEAIGLPYSFAPGDRVTLEEDERLLVHRAALEALGHTIGTRRPFGKANAIEWLSDGWRGAADPRSEGVAIGE